MKSIIDYLKERAFIESSTEGLEKITHKPFSVYAGFDPTSDSLHLGNLVGIIGLKHFQNFGHKPYILIGGATGRIGDPSGKSQERPLLDDATLQKNVRAITKFFESILDFSDEKVRPVIINNDDWFKKINFVDFLRDVGKQFRMGPMLAKDSVKQRLNSKEGMSFTEFSYQVLQGYDFYHLSQEENVVCQIGGSDQWGNITAGVELTRKLAQKQVHGLTFPLLTRSDGKKFGKTEEGAVWLSSEKLSPYHFYQYLIRVTDQDVIKLLKMLTFLEMDVIRDIEKGMLSPDYKPNTAQKILAEEVTRFIHGEKGLNLAKKVTEGAKPGAKVQLDAKSLQEISGDMPNFEISSKDLIGKKFTEIAHDSGLVQSKSEAVRLVKNGGAYLNNHRIEDPSKVLSEEDLIDELFVLIGSGKKKKILICVTP